MSWTFAWFSCVEPFAPVPAFQRMMDHDVRFVHCQGDAPYLQTAAKTVWGVSVPAITKTSTQADIEANHAALRAEPTWTALSSWLAERGRPLYYQPDDHEWGGDNWDHTITQANAAGFNLGCSTQAEVNTHWARCRAAALVYQGDNPANTDSEAVAGDLPSQASVGATPDAADYPVSYFRVGYDADGNPVTSNPFIEFFVLDTMSYRSPIAATDNASKTILGATQKAWLKARLPASGATFRPVLSNKKLYYATGADNSDIWSVYSTERDEILAHFDTQGVTCAPWLCGDRHIPMVASATKAAGYAADVLSLCACPTGVVNNELPNAVCPPHVWVSRQGQHHNNVYGLGIVESDRLTLQIRRGRDDAVLWSGYMTPGSNAVNYERTRIG